MLVRRKDLIYDKLKEFTRILIAEGIENKGKIGFDAKYIGKKVGVNRNNTSKELNCLLREGKVIKIKGKPVLYADREYLEEQFSCCMNDLIFEDAESLKLFLMDRGARNLIKDKNDKSIGRKEYNYNSRKNDSISSKVYVPFDDSQKRIIERKSVLDSIIGSQESFKTQIEQAKSAILYPPNGLHTLIVGPTGVGKTTFAEAMYWYAIEVGRIPKNSPFIVFNCADYSENPQLLLSQLYGHVKGAFTGADKSKKGLVDAADGGILCLDEVHRLPPEGQEMLFLLMDKGIYRRLGESEQILRAKVLIIGITTEEPESVLLKTFLRRIPLVISLPALKDRTMNERINFIMKFFHEESVRIKTIVKVSKEIIKAFMLYDCPGNVGQLKADIQLICARAFLDHITFNTDCVEVKLAHLSQRIKDGYFKISESRKVLAQNSNLMGSGDVVFDGSNIDMNSEIDEVIHLDKYRVEEDFYNLIENRWLKFTQEGLEGKEIHGRIDQEVRSYFNKFFPGIKPKDNSMDYIGKICDEVNAEVLKAVQSALYEVGDIECGSKDQKIIYGLALHVEALIERIRFGSTLSYPAHNKIKEEYPEDYVYAKKIKSSLEKNLSIIIPETEVAYLTMLLYSIRLGKADGGVGILVIAHGKAAASTMVNVTNTLLGIEHAHALDMPLDEKLDVFLEKVIEEVKQLDKGKGVLIMADMGSLTTFSDIIAERIGIVTRTVDMVSTPMVIEATRKALRPEMDIDTLVSEIRNSIPYMANTLNAENMNVKDNTNIYFMRTIVDILSETLTFLNPHKACGVLNEVLHNILDDMKVKGNDDITIKFLFHCSCMIERVIKGEHLPHKSKGGFKGKIEYIFNIVRNNFKLVEEIFGITIPKTEFLYIVDMLSIYYNTLDE